MAGRRTNKNPRVFRAVGNVTGRGVKGVSNILSGLRKGTGKLLYIGTNTANRIIGYTGRMGKRIIKKTRKFTGLRRK